MSSGGDKLSPTFWILVLALLLGGYVIYRMAMDRANDTTEMDRAIEQAR